MPEKVTLHEFLEIYSRRIVAIVVPVVVTLILDVILTRIIEQKSGSAQLNRNFADTLSTNDGGISIEWAFIIAAIVIVLLIVITAILLLCYWYGCTKAIMVWMGIAVVLLLSYYIYIAFGKIPRLFNISLDWVTAAIFILNLVVVGTLSIFWRAPPVVTQFFMIVISIATAIVFLVFPDWTIWALLVLLIIYDALMVLCPGGCLNLLVKKSQERGDALPALIYSSAVYMWKEGGYGANEDDNGDCGYAFDEENVEDQQYDDISESGSGEGEQNTDNNDNNVPKEQQHETLINPRRKMLQRLQNMQNNSIEAPNPYSANSSQQNEIHNNPYAQNEDVHEERREKLPLHKLSGKSTKIYPEDEFLDNQNVVQADPDQEANQNNQGKKKKKGKKKRKQAENEDEEEQEGVKLGLGDFVFYGILVTRAARLGWDIAVLCILAVLLGLSLTLVCLAIFERPLPALPFSLFLGIIFYIIAAYTFRPFATNIRDTLLVF